MYVETKTKKRLAVSMFLLFLCIGLAVKVKQEFAKNDTSVIKIIYDGTLTHGMKMYNPFLTYIDSDWQKREPVEIIWNRVWRMLPVEQYLVKEYENEMLVSEYMQGQQNPDTVQQAALEENAVAAQAQGQEQDIALWEAVAAENQAASQEESLSQASGFVPVTEPSATYSISQLKEKGFIKKTFYSEDPTTQIQESQIQYDTLMGFDATIKQDNSLPQILVYHTHSQETFIDSDPEDISTTIMGVGENLCTILRDEYGFNVIHHMGMYDVESRDYAYSNAAAGLEQVLAQNPSIEVIIDLHRDEVKADTKLVNTIQDIPMAKFMFFNGLSYSRELGALTSLPNPYVQDNISFAFQMQLAAEEYYPGATRRIYLKGYRYNLHYRPKSLLIELGAQTNTVDEAMNACGPLAHVISIVLNGENKTVY